MVLHSITHAQVLNAERKNDSPEKLARALLQLLFSSQKETAQDLCVQILMNLIVSGYGLSNVK